MGLRTKGYLIDMEHEDQDTGNASNMDCNRGSKTFLTQRYQVIIKLGFNCLTVGFHCKVDGPTKSRRTFTYLITLFSSFRNFQLGNTRTLADIHHYRTGSFNRSEDG